MTHTPLLQMPALAGAAEANQVLQDFLTRLWKLQGAPELQLVWDGYCGVPSCCAFSSLGMVLATIRV